MRAVPTQFRRFVASLMLVAMASLGLHNGAFAGAHRHGPAQMECEAGHRHAHAAHNSAPAGHLHTAGQHHHPHHSPAAEAPDEAGEPTSAGFEGSCCTGGCPVALTAPVPQAVTLPLTGLLRQLYGAETGAVTTLDGLKRPPRTLGMA